MVCTLSIGHYREILKIGLAHGYKFVSYEELDGLAQGQKACVLRHDIDYMPEWSVPMGKVEQELGLQSTFFFQVCAKPYNLREKHNFHVVQELHAMGHQLGLHFDLSWDEDVKFADIHNCCRKDKEVLQSIVGLEPCDIVSFHNPHRFAELILNKEVPGIRHTYEKAYFSAIKYLSDSQGWYEACLCKLLGQEKYPRIQFLTHPYIWPEGGSGDFIANTARMIQGRTEELVQYLLKFHPVCRKNEERLRKELSAAQAKKVGVNTIY